MNTDLTKIKQGMAMQDVVSALGASVGVALTRDAKCTSTLATRYHLSSPKYI